MLTNKEQNIRLGSNRWNCAKRKTNLGRFLFQLRGVIHLLVVSERNLSRTGVEITVAP
jgi:hypothetical protein